MKHIKNLIWLLIALVVFLSSYACFAQSTDAALTTLMNQVRNETGSTQNTAIRVGDALLALVNSKVNINNNSTISVSGTDAYTGTVTPAIASYVVGTKVYIIIGTTNTGASTINLNSLGAKTIKKDGTVNLAAGDLPSGSIRCLIYDGTYFQLVGSGQGLPSQLGNSGKFLTTNGTTASWGTVSQTFAGLSDVSFTGLTSNDFVKYNGSVWVNRTVPNVRTDLGLSTSDSPTFTGLLLSGQTASTIASFDGSKNLVSLSTSIYPSLTELSYVKGVTSSIQTQLDAKQATLISGTNIKTVNGSSLLGSGDIGTINVSHGGTGAATLTGVLVGNGTSAITAITGTASQLLRRNAGNTAYEFFTPTYTSLTNSAAANELMKSDGTNAVASGLESTALGDFNLGRTGVTAGAGRSILAKGSASDIAMYIQSKGTGSLNLTAGTSAGATFSISSSGSADCSIYADPGLLTYGAIRIGTTSATLNETVTITRNSTTLNGIIYPLAILSRPANTVSAGSGVGMKFRALTNFSGDNYEDVAIIEAVTTDVTSTSEDADLVFKTMDAGATPNEKVRIKSSGEVGINNTSPNAKLEVSEASGEEIARFSANGGSGSVQGTGYIGLSHFTTGTYPSASIGVEEASVSSYNSRLIFSTRSAGSDSAPTERIRINENGAIGISGANFGTSGQILTSAGSGSSPTWTTGFTNPMTTGGDIIYGGASGAPTRLANGSSGQVLTSSGGTSAPTWTTPTTTTSSSWTPTLANVSNSTSRTLQKAYYSRNGIIVTCSVFVAIDPTTTGTVTISITLPVASNLTGNFDVIGNGNGVLGLNYTNGVVAADTSGDKAEFSFNATVDDGSDNFAIIFQYEVK